MKAFYVIILCLIMTSCFQEELEPSDYESRGSWDSRRYAIQIFRNGSASLDIRYRGHLEDFVKIQGNYMIFTSENENDEIGYKKFHIDQRPTTDCCGITYMILDGHRLEKL